MPIKLSGGLDPIRFKNFASAVPTASANANRVLPSGIREIARLATNQPGVIRLEIGEPDFPTPPHIAEAAIDAARRGPKYTPSAGTAAFRDAVVRKIGRLYGMDVLADQVIATQGGMQGCALAFAALVQPGSEVLIPDPGYPNHEMLVRLLEGQPVRYPLYWERGFVPDPGDVAALITNRTTAICINSPSNPTGSVFPPYVVEALVKLARGHDLPVISDEVYDELIFDGSPPNAFQYGPDDVVSVMSLSKTYAMTGWRVGFVIAPHWLAPRLAILQEALITCLSSVSQAAAVAALEGPQDCIAMMRERYRIRRDMAVEVLGPVGPKLVVPQGAFYILVPVPPGLNSHDLAIDLVRHHGVAVSPGRAFGVLSDGFLRISLTQEDKKLEAGIQRIVEVLHS